MFHNRLDAGSQLAQKCEHLRNESPVVLGLPRGGVPVAAVVAKFLHAPLDVIVVRKLGLPTQPEVAMGAIGEGGARVLDTRLMRLANVSEQQLQYVEQHEREVLHQRLSHIRSERERVSLKGRTVIIVDDGLATGATATLACQIARENGAAKVVLAVPVAPKDAINDLPADEVITVMTPQPFGAVGMYYREFDATSDTEVLDLLRAANIEQE